MKKNYINISILFILLLFVNCNGKKEAVVLIENNENELDSNFFLPFATASNRDNIKTISDRIGDGYGAYRIRGHKHAGLDISGYYNENVYSIGNGIVVDNWYSFPNTAVVIEYKFSDEKKFYVSYVHLGEIFVQKGVNVDSNTIIGRLFNESEFADSDFEQNHLHLEVRKSIEDNGKASYSCKTVEELNHYFYDPFVFFQNELGN